MGKARRFLVEGVRNLTSPNLTWFLTERKVSRNILSDTSLAPDQPGLLGAVDML